MEIKFNNLKIKKISYHDIDLLLGWYNNPKIMSQAGFNSGLNVTKQDLINNIKNYKNDLRVKFIMYVNNNPIGDLSYHKFDNDIFQIGINILIKDYQDMGYGTNFLRIFINYLFKEKNANKITLNVRSSNDRAIHVYEKLNFIYISSFTKNNILFKEYELSKKDFYILDKYQYLLFDIDDTLLSFSKAERKALSLALSKYNVEVNDKILDDYHYINIKYWKQVENKIITRDECLILRFDEFLKKHNINVSSYEFEDVYRFYLNKQHYLIKDARLILQTLQQTHKLYAITNGVYNTQKYRMSKAKIDKYFIKSFVSELVGHNKPDIKFAIYIEKNITSFDKSKALIIGDSLTSDIRLGNNSNIDTCYVNINRTSNKTDIKYNYKINYLKELLLLKD